LRILHILDHSIPLHSGYTFRTCAILNQQRALGWETFHITSSKHAHATEVKAPYEQVDGLGFYRTSRSSGFISKLPVLNQVAIIRGLEKRLSIVAAEVRPDILHAHSPALNGAAAVNVGKCMGIPVVYEVRAFWEDAAVDHGTSSEGGLRYRLTRGLETSVLRRSDAITTICEGLRSDIIGRGIADEKVTVIPNAVDVSRFPAHVEADNTLASQLGIAGATVLGFVGSFYAYEGISLLLEALPSILESRADVRVLLVGGGPEEENLKRQAGELGLGEKVVFAGRVPHDQVKSYYGLIDILAYPRLSMRLTDLVTPLKPLEAMAQRRLFVASDVGGHRELIEDGGNGVLFQAGDAHALAAAILGLLQHPERWDALRDAGRAFVETERNWQASVGRYRDVYEPLLEPSKHG